MKKNERGITLSILVIIIIALMLISVPIVVNVTQVISVNRFAKFKDDLEVLKEAVATAYSSDSILLEDEIGTIYTGTNLNYNNSITKNPNDDTIYFIIDINKLNSRLKTHIRKLNYGEKNYNLEKLTDDVYIINRTSKTIYYVKGIEYKNRKYYRLPEKYKMITISNYVEE